LHVLVLDEADRCLDLGFKTAMNAIIEGLPPTRQTLLFSATQTRSVTDLARLSLDKPVYVSVHENSETSTPDGLTQSYVITQVHHKIDIMWSFLKNHRKKKILVFLQSCKQVKYICEIFTKLICGTQVLALYGTMPQFRRMAVYDSFVSKQFVVMFSTDVAARGLDFPAVDWVIQMDCPEDGVTYVHRAGRTARYKEAGESLLMLTPTEEKGMLKQLSALKIPISKIEINPKKLTTIRGRIASALACELELKESAQRAFQSYIKSVYLMKNKNIFNVESIDMNKFSESLGLVITPRVRFLDKQKKQKAGKEITSTNTDQAEVEGDNNQDQSTEGTEKKEESSSKIKFFDSDDENDEDVLTVKQINVQLKDDNKEDQEEEKIVKKTKTKVLTKEMVAKKLLNKKIVANTRVEFGEDGEEILDADKVKVSAEGKEYEADNTDEVYDIVKARKILQAEDEIDKKRYAERLKAKKKAAKFKEKEARRKAQGIEEGRDKFDEEDDNSDVNEDVDLSWLPDPDEVYGKQDDGNDDKQSDQHEESSDDDDKSSDDEEKSSDDDEGSSDDDDGESSEDADNVIEETIVKQKAHSTTTIKKVIPKNVDVHKANKLEFDTGLSLQDEEDLALQLLMK